MAIVVRIKLLYLYELEQLSPDERGDIVIRSGSASSGIACLMTSMATAAKAGAAGEWPLAGFTGLGVRVERIMTDNAPAYRSRSFAILCRRHGIRRHAGHSIAENDTIRSHQLATVAFQRVLINGKLPTSPAQPAQA